jgi:hypothetical protein
MATKLDQYLGSQVSIILSKEPFKHWVFDRSVDEELDVPLVHYVFPVNGLELRCDLDGRISVIFLYADEFGGFQESLQDISLSWTRQQVLDYFGPPSKSGSPRSHSILGEYGPWDRFSMPEYGVRFEYRIDGPQIKNITFMRKDVIP